MKRFALCMVFLGVVGCLAPETKTLARIVANSTAKQQDELTELGEMKLDTGQKISDTQRGRILLKRAQKLTEATSGLADLVGAPEEVE